MYNVDTTGVSQGSVENLAQYIVDMGRIGANNVAMLLCVADPDRFSFEQLGTTVKRAIICGDFEARLAFLPGHDPAASPIEATIDWENTFVSAQALVKWGKKIQPYPKLLQLIENHLAGEPQSFSLPSSQEDSQIGGTRLPIALMAYQHFFSGKDRQQWPTNPEMVKHLMDTHSISQAEANAIVSVIKPEAHKLGGRRKAMD